jgi:hypothetical protein
MRSDAFTLTTEYLLSRIMPITESGCWIWMGEVAKSHGYSIVNARRSIKSNTRGRDYGHRVFYELFKGPIPAGLTIDHLCRVRCCVNPNHLEAVTIGVNVLRGESTSARHRRKTHCRYGHPLQGDNLYFIRTRPRTRLCNICRRVRDKKSQMNRQKRKKHGLLQAM